jgi:CRP/FNR family cyclic AMP-dependent transcriptional regulator
MDSDKLQLLQRMPIFGGVNADALSFLLERALSVDIPSGDHFFREGDSGTSAYVLESGRVSVVKDWKGSDYHLRDLEAGDCFGEVALFDFGNRSASVRALEDCVALELTARSLYALSNDHLQQFAIVYMNLGREIARRLRVADDRIFQAKVQHADSLVEGYRFASA